MRRINWPFAAITFIGITAGVAWYFDWKFDVVPWFIRGFWVVFGFPAFFTLVLSSLVNLFTPMYKRQREHRFALGVAVVHLALPVIAICLGLFFEIPNMVAYGSTGRWALLAGGLVVLLLQGMSCLNIHWWRRWQLFEDVPPEEQKIKVPPRPA